MPREPTRIAMRWKMLGAFAAAFTAVFGFIAVWVVADAADAALVKITDQLGDAAVGGAQLLDQQVFTELVATVPAVPDPGRPGGLGYPDSPLFRQIAGQLFNLTKVVPDAQPFTYFRDPDDGELYFAASAGYFAQPQYGVTFRQPVAQVSQPEDILLMERGLTQTTFASAYTDAFGSWISVYTPIFDNAGVAVGALGVDYPTDYVDAAQREAITDILPVLLASYAVLLLLVLGVSTALVRPLRRLTAATERIADGEYDLAAASLAQSRFPDEIYELGQSFDVMAAKVAEREKSLSREVQRLRVQIDTRRKDEAVKEIVETDFFADLEARAAQLRARRRAQSDQPPVPDDDAPGPTVGPGQQ